MDDDRRELLRRLFAAVTELIETAHDAAVAGQSGEIAAENYTEASRRLRAAACDVVALADAATVLARPDTENGLDSLSNHAR